MAQSKKEIIDEQDFIKIKNFCSMKDNVKRIIWATDWEKMLTKDTGDKRLLSKMYQKLLKCSNKKTNHLIKKWTKDLKWHFMKCGIHVNNKYMKRCSTSYVIWEMQITWQWATTTYLLKWPKFRTLHQMLAKVWNNRNSHSLPVAMQNGIFTF